MSAESLLGLLGKYAKAWFDAVRSDVRHAAIATALAMMLMFTLFLSTQGEFVSKVFDYYAGSSERANAAALAAIEQQDEANDIAISFMLRRLMSDLHAGRVVVKILVFDEATGEFSDLAESHEIMDRRAERTGLRSRQLTRNDVQNTLDQMFPSDGRVVCMTAATGDVPDQALELFLLTGMFAWTSACPIIDANGTPVGLLAVSGRRTLEDRQFVTQRVRDSAFLLSGYLLRSPAAATARERLKDRQ